MAKHDQRTLPSSNWCCTSCSVGDCGNCVDRTRSVLYDTVLNGKTTNVFIRLCKCKGKKHEEQE